MGKYDKYLPRIPSPLQMIMQEINLLPWAVRTGNMTPNEAEDREKELWAKAKELVERGAEWI